MKYICDWAAYQVMEAAAKEESSALGSWVKRQKSKGLLYTVELHKKRKRGWKACKHGVDDFLSFAFTAYKGLETENPDLWLSAGAYRAASFDQPNVIFVTGNREFHERFLVDLGGWRTLIYVINSVRSKRERPVNVWLCDSPSSSSPEDVVCLDPLCVPCPNGHTYKGMPYIPLQLVYESYMKLRFDAQPLDRETVQREKNYQFRFDEERQHFVRCSSSDEVIPASLLWKVSEKNDLVGFERTKPYRYCGPEFLDQMSKAYPRPPPSPSTTSEVTSGFDYGEWQDGTLERLCRWYKDKMTHPERYLSGLFH